ncbi:cupin domain-containing protein [Sabulicella glaciei]|uniref:Cupin domain-containing protein n=1 Tax=Sabulicella glaciei TaxID=2984948 RepID=A0ABT3P022_9PROT|nr:cupin domain-containing protein [Roseococcus sp. MDT2-1-1]
MSLAEEAFATAFPGLAVEEVLALREGRDWRLFRGNDPARFAGLLSVSDLDAHLRTDGARSPRVSMADEAREGSAGVPEDEFALPDGRVDLPRLLGRFDAGASLVLSQFHETHPPLQRFCRGLEKLFLHAVQANIYLTPPGAQGFRTHYDTHDVLVLQVEGRKRWRVWDGERVERPTRRTPWPGHLAPEGEPHLVSLAPGDALYLPRGVMHDAATEPGERSLHITIGLLEPSWAQAIRALVDAAELDDPALREAVPTWRIGETEFESALAAKLARLAGAEQAERLANLLLEQLSRDRQPLPARGLFAPMPEGALRLSDGMHHHLAQAPDGAASLHWSGGRLALTPEEAESVVALAEGAVPADRALAEKLWRMGLLEPVSDPPPA